MTANINPLKISLRLSLYKLFVPLIITIVWMFIGKLELHICRERSQFYLLLFHSFESVCQSESLMYDGIA